MWVTDFGGTLGTTLPMPNDEIYVGCSAISWAKQRAVLAVFG